MSPVRTVVPRPLSLVAIDSADVAIGPGTRIVTGTGPDEVTAGVLLAESLSARVKVAVGVDHLDDADLRAAEGTPGTVTMRLDPGAGPASAPPDERYELRVAADAVVARAPAPAGILRAITTFTQLAARSDVNGFVAPAVEVSDAPRYGWRGLTLDVARHFFTVPQLKVVMGLMARYKLNVLHLHLSDDQGWRIEIPSRPQLTQYSGGTAVDGGSGGFYTVADFAEIQAYAAARHITVVPEVDVPGHTHAALHAYPELNPDGAAPPAYTGIDVGFSTLHTALPATEPFVRDVFGDLAAMTDGPYVHLGGDESLVTPPGDYARIVELAAQTIRDAGKVVVGWQEITATAAGVDGVIQVWDHREPPDAVVGAARKGATVLLSPANRTYLDIKYDETTPLGQAWTGPTELRTTYDWDPATFVPGLAPGAVVGVGAAAWTETLHSLEDLTYMLLPRLAAVAEVGWTDTTLRDWDDFADRVRTHRAFWDAMGYSWHASPGVDW